MGLAPRALCPHSELCRHRPLPRRRCNRQTVRLLRAARSAQGRGDVAACRSKGEAAGHHRRQRPGRGAPAQARRRFGRRRGIPRASEQGRADPGGRVGARRGGALGGQRERAAVGAGSLCRRPPGDRFEHRGHPRTRARGGNRPAVSAGRRRRAGSGARAFRGPARHPPRRNGRGGTALGGAGFFRGRVPRRLLDLYRSLAGDGS